MDPITMKPSLSSIVGSGLLITGLALGAIACSDDDDPAVSTGDGTTESVDGSTDEPTTDDTEAPAADDTGSDSSGTDDSSDG
jgi:hypothetical protein